MSFYFVVGAWFNTGMEKQLTLIEETSFSVRQPAKMKAIKRNEIQVWWRLTKEEKAQGLAGVRAIRAILQNTSTDSEFSMAKAS